MSETKCPPPGVEARARNGVSGPPRGILVTALILSLMLFGALGLLREALKTAADLSAETTAIPGKGARPSPIQGQTREGAETNRLFFRRPVR